MLGRIPARSQWQGYGKRRPGDSEKASENERLFKAVNPEIPGGEQGDNNDHLSDGAGRLWFDVIDQQTHDDAQDGPGKHWSSDHQALLGMGQGKVLGNLYAKRAEHHPD